VILLRVSKFSRTTQDASVSRITSLNPFYARCHRLLLQLWDGKTSTLLKGVSLMGGEFTIEEEGRNIGKEEVSRMLTDYIIQGQVMSMVMGLVDDEDGWHGPEYVAKHEFMVGRRLISLPKESEVENAQQKEAREIVEACLQRSFG
jgi:hypothetical protein